MRLRNSMFAGIVLVSLSTVLLFAACSGQGKNPLGKDGGEDLAEGGGDVADSELVAADAVSPDALAVDGIEPAADGEELPGELPCLPQCEGKECGDDGCGSHCGICPEAAPVCENFKCAVECFPDCDGKECGSDGCDGECGVCPEVAPYCVEHKCAVDCDQDCVGKECGDDGCGGSCGDCAGQQEECTDGMCVCLPFCEDKECGDDGCGGDCGSCPEGSPFCTEGVCTGECEPDCADKDCGDDGCGGSCGGCAGELEECFEHQCVCVPDCGPGSCGDDGCGGDCGVCECDEKCSGGMCSFVGCGGKICGEDGCGESCGACPGGSVCTDEGSCLNQCDLNCEGKECGSDGCSGSCGSCESWAVCTDDGACVEYCEPDCAGKECGGNGCGGSCGACNPLFGGQYCVAGQCVNECEAECGMKECGDDGCGNSCGDCAGDLLCTMAGTCGGVCSQCSFADFCYTMDFSDASLADWAAEAVVVVHSMGVTDAPSGGAMLKLTTGEGLTESSSSAIFQDCLPGGEYMLFVRWKLYSEEFKEWCGSTYQDSMKVYVESELASAEMLEYTIDDLCPPEDCQGCGSAYDGLIQSDVILDQGDVWNTTWREEWLPVTLPDGEVFDLHLELEDAGDGIYDTVLLVDRLQLLPCEEACQQLECGENPCGGDCGECDAGGECMAGVCCYPSCDGKECGDDGCGGSCGLCGSLSACSMEGNCVCKHEECDDGCCGLNDVCSALSGKCCHPVCTNNQCGDDGCGGLCSGWGVECCTLVQDCDDGDDCTIDQCHDNVCQHTPSGAPECCDQFLWEKDFDDETEQGFTLENTGMGFPGMDVGWQVAGECGFHSAPAALYFGSVGNPFFGECTYAGGIPLPLPLPLSGTATSEEIGLPDGGPISLSFWTVTDIQAAADIDVLLLEVITPPEEQLVWSKADVDWGFGEEWHKVTVDLSDWAGYDVRLRWSFDTPGGADAGGIGVLVDDIQVIAECD